MTFELVEITTADNLIHQGMFHVPETHGKRAVLWVHGLTGKFYGNVKLMNLLAEHCGKLGLGFASFNTRGHDVIAGINVVDASQPTGYGHAMGGAGLEKFEDSAIDIDAGITFLEKNGFSEIILAGHSTGANKVCFYAATMKDSRVMSVILAGPISDRYSPVNDKEHYEKNMTMLKMLRDEGKGDTLITKAMWMPATADRIWSLIAPNTPEDVFNYGDTDGTLSVFSRITKPTLIVLAGNEEHADRPVDDIRKAFDTHTAAKNYKSIVIPETLHGYEGKENEFVSAVVTWCAAL